MSDLRWVQVWDTSAQPTTVNADEEPRIDAAVSQWLASGKTQDTLLDLVTPEGATYKCLASIIVGWYCSTPETRRKRLELNKELDDTDKATKAEIGIWGDDE